ncbi:hypothetical protein [Streptomyces sp. KL116D]
MHSNDYGYAALRPDAKYRNRRLLRDVFAKIKFLTEHPVIPRPPRDR